MAPAAREIPGLAVVVGATDAVVVHPEEVRFQGVNGVGVVAPPLAEWIPGRGRRVGVGGSGEADTVLRVGLRPANWASPLAPRSRLASTRSCSAPLIWAKPFGSTMEGSPSLFRPALMSWRRVSRQAALGSSTEEHGGATSKVMLAGGVEGGRMPAAEAFEAARALRDNWAPRSVATTSPAPMAFAPLVPALNVSPPRDTRHNCARRR